MDHVGVVVEDVEAAAAFFVELGMEVEGRTSVSGAWAGRIVGLEDLKSDVVMMRTPDGQSKLELCQFHAPAAVGGGFQPANVVGLRHLAFVVEDLDDTLARLAVHGGELVGTVEAYAGVLRLCYLRGPEGIIVELCEELRS